MTQNNFITTDCPMVVKNTKNIEDFKALLIKDCPPELSEKLQKCLKVLDKKMLAFINAEGILTDGSLYGCSEGKRYFRFGVDLQCAIETLVGLGYDICFYSHPHNDVLSVLEDNVLPNIFYYRPQNISVTRELYPVDIVRALDSEDVMEVLFFGFDSYDAYTVDQIKKWWKDENFHEKQEKIRVFTTPTGHPDVKSMSLYTGHVSTTDGGERGFAELVKFVEDNDTPGDCVRELVKEIYKDYEE